MIPLPQLLTPPHYHGPFDWERSRIGRLAVFVPPQPVGTSSGPPDVARAVPILGAHIFQHVGIFLSVELVVSSHRSGRFAPPGRGHLRRPDAVAPEL
jgi:hypothetical protein